jgi:hypothetical protein
MHLFSKIGVLVFGDEGWIPTTKLSLISKYISRVGLCLPFVAVLVLAFAKPLSRLAISFGCDETFVSNLSVLRAQYDFLVSKGLASGVAVCDFWVFEGFIWIASITAVARVLTGICRETLRSEREKLEIVERKGRSAYGLLNFLLLGGLLGILFSLHFEFVYHSDQMRFLMKYAPNAFICVQVFLFCTGVSFVAEGLLFLGWLLFMRKRSADATPRRQGNLALK